MAIQVLYRRFNTIKFIKTFIALAFFALASITGHAQAPQTQSSPLWIQNSQWVNGFSPSYSWDIAKTSLLPPLGVFLDGGTTFACGSQQDTASTTLTLTANATNYIFVNTAASCSIQAS